MTTIWGKGLKQTENEGVTGDKLKEVLKRLSFHLYHF